VIPGNWRISVGFWRLAIFLSLALAGTDATAADFRFDRDTFTFANMTVFEYQNGIAHLRRGEQAKERRYTRRCFVLSRAAMQFRKFARFEPHALPLGDGELAARIRMVTTRAAWRPELPQNQRIVFPGYADLRQMSKARGRILQENVGLGWPTYWRPGLYRIFFENGVAYQEKTHENLNATLARGDLFVGFLTTLPKLRINHAVLVYSKKLGGSTGMDRYLVYDPNHPDGPRELTWSQRDRAFTFQKDWDFIGGFVRVYQVYGKPLQ
jgi:hypothetical protein